jgi:gliding-associated putative ABC transporter substrate-binding component GldG
LNAANGDDAMTTTQTPKYRSLTRAGLILAILVLANIVSVRIFTRLDLTRGRVFTLSDASKSLMRNLDDRMTARAFFTDDLPAPYNSNRRTLLDELNEYKAYAKGNFQIEFLDPTGEKGEAEAQQAGIAPLQVQVIKEDKAQVQRAYMGMVLLYEDKKEVLPVIQNTATLEYDISSAVKRLTSRSRQKIAFLNGQGEPALTDLRAMQEVLKKQYDVTTVDVSRGTPVPQDIAALIVMAPTGSFSGSQKYQIDQYLMRGGRIAFLLNAVDASLQQQQAQPVNLDLNDQLSAYGVRLNTDLVRDVQCASVSLVQQQYGFSFQSQVPFPYLPMVSNFSKDNAMVKGLRGMVLFFPSSIDTADVAARGLKGEILLRSSKQSGRLTGPFFYDPLARFTGADFPENGIPLGAMVEGKFTSFYKGKPVPADTAAGSLPPEGVQRNESPETRIVLIGDGDFARDQYLGGSRDNITFFANLVDYLVDDAGLISIRSKEASDPPLPPIDDGTKKVLKALNLVVPPLLVILYGLFRWRMRKSRKKILDTAL